MAVGAPQRAPRPARALGADGRPRARGHQLLVVLAVVDVLVDGRADDLPARVRLRLRLARQHGRRLRLRRVRRHRHGGDGGAVLERFPRDVRDVRQVPVPATYDAILAAPVDTEELVSAEALWIAARAGVYGCVPMLVAMSFGLDPRGGCRRAVDRLIAGFGWACFGITIAGYAKSFENFSYIVSAVLTPLFLVAGTFFPISELPEWAQVLGELQPAPPVRRARARRRVRLRGLGRPRCGSRASSGSASSCGASRSTR